MGSFVPSNGVGTGFTREALENLANSENNLVFEPTCLTEDYENGLRLHRLGSKQMFVPLSVFGTTKQGATVVATRELFPLKAHDAIKQRSRWILGIGLQCWERNGWRGSWSEKYWFWRDRKGRHFSVWPAHLDLREICRSSMGTCEILAASLVASSNARDPDGAKQRSDGLLRPVLRPAVRSGGGSNCVRYSAIGSTAGLPGMPSAPMFEPGFTMNRLNGLKPSIAIPRSAGGAMLLWRDSDWVGVRGGIRR